MSALHVLFLLLGAGRALGPPACEEREIRIEVAPSVELAGTLALPPGSGPFPAVVLVQGGSPFDRDGTFAGHKPLAVLAEAFARSGFATLRVDDRGVGGSGGAKLSTTLDELARDLEECVCFLRAEPSVDAARVGALGHSGGALLASIVAARDPALAFVVLLGCPALPLPALIAAQMAAEGDGSLETGTLLGNAAAEIVREIPDDPELAVVVGERWTELVAALPAATRREGELFVSSMTRRLPALLGSAYLRDVYVFDPGPVLRRITCPVFALWGELDQGRKLPNASAWELTRCLASGACASFQVVQVPRTNHFLQTAVTGAPDEFARIEETVSPEVLRSVRDWTARWVEGR